MVDIEKWKEHRRITFMLFFFQCSATGVQNTMMQSSLFGYISVWRTHHINFYYGLTTSAQVFAPILLASLVSRYADEYRHIKLYMNICNFIFIIGSVIYMLPYSIYFPFIGRALQGVIYLARIFIHSEVNRVYPKGEINQRIILLILGYGVGEIIGAVLMTIAESIDFFIGDVHLVYGNFPPLVLAITMLILIPAIMISAHDLSNEFDFKTHEYSELYHAQQIALKKLGNKDGYTAEEDDETRKLLQMTENSVPRRNMWIVKLRRDFTFDAVYLLTVQFYSAFWILTVSFSIPYTVKRLHLHPNAIQYSYITLSSVTVLISLILYRMQLKSRGVYALGIISLTTSSFLAIVTFLISTELSYPLSYPLLGLFLVLGSILFVCDNVFVIVTLGCLFDSTNQCMVEGLRMIIYLSGGILSGFLVSQLFNFVNILFPLSVCMTFIFLVWLIRRRKTLSNPAVNMFTVL